MFRQTIAVTVVAAILATAGCGGGGDSGKKDNALSSVDQVKIVQAIADIDELCGYAKSKEKNAYQRFIYSDAATVAVRDSVPGLIDVYRKNPQKLSVDKVGKTSVTMRELLRQQVEKLSTKCGPRGKRFASQIRLAAR